MHIGRFAPTLSGPLHFGSLITAVASYLDAKSNNGEWLLHLDDLDQPRVDPDAERSICATLEHHGLFWDRQPVYQTRQTELYDVAIEKLHQLGVTFFCTCSRKQRSVAKSYPGTCRWRKQDPGPSAMAGVRVEAGNDRLIVEDRIQGTIERSMDEVGGDYVVRRRDGLPSYHLTTVIDDAGSAVSDVVRGADLFEQSVYHIQLHHLLDLSPVRYAHVPVLNCKDEIKLSKRNDATAVDDAHAVQNLRIALRLLNLDPPKLDSVEDCISWGISNWEIENVPSGASLTNYYAI